MGKGSYVNDISLKPASKKTMTNGLQTLCKIAERIRRTFWRFGWSFANALKQNFKRSKQRSYERQFF